MVAAARLSSWRKSTRLSVPATPCENIVAETRHADAESHGLDRPFLTQIIRWYANVPVYR